MSNSMKSPYSLHHPVCFFFFFLSGSSRHRSSGEREQRRGKRDREKEGWSDRKRREWEHISRPFSVTFVLSVWRATMNINMNPWRGNIVFFFSFSSHWAIHAHKKSIQVNVMANLWACAWLCEQCSLGSTSSLSLSWVWLGLYQWKTLYVKCNCGEHYNM